MMGYDLQVPRQYLKQLTLIKTFKYKFHCSTNSVSRFLRYIYFTLLLFVAFHDLKQNQKRIIVDFISESSFMPYILVHDFISILFILYVHSQGVTVIFHLIPGKEH